MAAWRREAAAILQVILMLYSLPCHGQDFNVVLKLQNEGESLHSDVLTPDTTITINCTHGLSLNNTKLITIVNGSSTTVYHHNYVNNEGAPGPSFTSIVSSPQVNQGDWLSIQFSLPSCYANTGFKCTVYNQDVDSKEDTKTFSLATLSPPVVSCENCGSIKPDQPDVSLDKDYTLTCSVHMVAPQVTLVWEPSACVQLKSTFNTTVSEVCKYNQTSSVTINKATTQTCVTKSRTFKLKCIARSSLLPDKETEVTINNGVAVQSGGLVWCMAAYILVSILPSVVK